MNTDPQAREVLIAIGNALVSDASAFRVEVDFSGLRATVLSIRCAGQDRGRLIGRDGRMFKSLLHIVQAIGETKGHQIEISEVKNPPIPALSPRLPQPVYRDDWPERDIVGLARIVCSAAFGAPADIQCHRLPRGACLSVRVAPSPRVQAEQLKEAIRTVFRAVGINHGCKLVVDFL